MFRHVHRVSMGFGRFADPGGLTSSVSFLAQGGTLSQLEVFFLSANEFFMQEGSGTQSGFLSALYQVALHRAIDSGAQSLGEALSSGASRAILIQAVLNSAESHRQLVQGLYVRYLGRPADGGGLASALGLLQTGASIEQLAAILIASPEYLSRL